MYETEIEELREAFRTRTNIEEVLTRVARAIAEEQRSLFVCEHPTKGKMIRLWEVSNHVGRNFPREIAIDVGWAIRDVLMREECKVATTPMALN